MYQSFLDQVGDVGRHQILTLVICALIKCFGAVFTLIPVLTNLKRPYSCAQWSGISSNTTLTCNDINNNITCQEWEFSNESMHSTIYSQYGLTCDTEYLVQISVTIYFIGFTLGCPLYGKASDRWGRWVMVQISAIHLLVASLIIPFLPYFWLYCLFRFIAGAGTGGVLVTGYTLNAEETSNKHRVFFCLMITMGWSTGISLTALVGHFVRDHVWLQVCLCIPFLVVIVVSMLFLKESARWLLETGHHKRFRHVVAVIAKRNGRLMPSDDFLKDLEEEGLRLTKAKEEPDNKITLRDIRQQQHFCCTVIIHWVGWFLVSCAYYTSSLGVGLLSGNVFLTLGLAGIIEIPARLVAYYVSTKVGRVPILSGCFILGGIFCIISAALMDQSELSWLLIALNLLSKILFLNAFEFIWIYSAEIYPTSIRNRGIGLGSMWARVGAMTSPLLLLLHEVRTWAPFIMLGLASVAIGCVTLLTPETRGRNLPPTIKEANRRSQTSTLRSICVRKRKKNQSKENSEEIGDVEEEL